MKCRCSNCGKFIGEIKRLNYWSFTRSKKLELEGNQLLVTCKCGEVHKIDLKPFQEEKNDENY